MPTRQARWEQRSNEYANTRRGSETCRANTFRCLRAWRKRLLLLDYDVSHPADLTEEMVLRWKANPVGPGAHGEGSRLLPSTAFQALWILRGFLCSAGNPIAANDNLWAFASAPPMNRRYFDKEQLESLFAGCKNERERVAIALAGFNGLRRIEIVRLTVGCLDLAQPSPAMNVHGKGRNGGKWRHIPMSSVTYAALVSVALGKSKSAPVYSVPKGTPEAAYRRLDADIRAVGRRMGIEKISMHDLRRSFGRLWWKDNRNLVVLKNIYGHASLDMTLHYIGADDAEMATEMALFSASFGSRSAKGVGPIHA